jgi:Protein of unknown function (DUF3108)
MNGRSWTRGLLSSALVVLLAHVPAPASAQQAPKRVVEHADFDVKLGFLRVGSGQWTVSAYDTVSGFPTFHAVLTISGGFGPARIDDKFESWGDATSWRTSRDVFSRRFVQTQREVNYQRNNRFEISPERQEWVRNGGPINKTPTSKPLDDLTMLVFVRSLPLKVGDVYVIPGYFKAEDNPVTIRVLRRETVKVPAGTFATVVVRPTIKTSGLFGNAELYLTDDRFHSLVQLKSKARKLGTMTLELKKYEPPDVADDPQGSPMAWGTSELQK